ncbi:MAG: prepilin-type N-terminal cleavage/methylation domain-containing protein [Patescibacteria group bacterium]
MPKSVDSLKLTVHSKEKTVNREPLTVNKRQRRFGFSLIEVLLSVFILIILTAILLTASGTLTLTRQSNLQSTASKIASKKVEDLRNTAFASLPASGPFADPNLSKLPQGAATLTVSNYQSSTQIKQVSINVTWVVNSTTRQVHMDTLIYENGI